MTFLRTTSLLAALLCAAPVLAQTAPDRADFVAKAGAGNLFEIESSKLAVATLPKGPEVEFARQMIADHTKAGDNMKEAAQAEGMTAAPALTPEQQQTLAALKNTSAKELPAAYVAAQVKAHDEAVALFAAYAQGGQPGALRDFAGATLPTLKSHQMHVPRTVGYLTRPFGASAKRHVPPACLFISGRNR